MRRTCERANRIDCEMLERVATRAERRLEAARRERAERADIVVRFLGLGVLINVASSMSLTDT